MFAARCHSPNGGIHAQSYENGEWIARGTALIAYLFEIGWLP
jgi:hypothetical protein